MTNKLMMSALMIVAAAAPRAWASDESQVQQKLTTLIAAHSKELKSLHDRCARIDGGYMTSVPRTVGLIVSCDTFIYGDGDVHGSFNVKIDELRGVGLDLEEDLAAMPRWGVAPLALLVIDKGTPYKKAIPASHPLFRSATDEAVLVDPAESLKRRVAAEMAWSAEQERRDVIDKRIEDSLHQAFVADVAEWRARQEEPKAGATIAGPGTIPARADREYRGQETDSKNNYESHDEGYSCHSAVDGIIFCGPGSVRP